MSRATARALASLQLLVTALVRFSLSLLTCRTGDAAIRFNCFVPSASFSGCTVDPSPPLYLKRRYRWQTLSTSCWIHWMPDRTQLPMCGSRYRRIFVFREDIRKHYGAFPIKSWLTAVHNCTVVVGKHSAVLLHLLLPQLLPWQAPGDMACLPSYSCFVSQLNECTTYACCLRSAILHTVGSKHHRR